MRTLAWLIDLSIFEILHAIARMFAGNVDCGRPFTVDYAALLTLQAAVPFWIIVLAHEYETRQAIKSSKPSQIWTGFRLIIW
jgi:hypothetical protein